MTHIEKSTFEFLKDLKENNHRDWFHDNKKRYQMAKENFAGFVDELIAAITSFDSRMAGTEAKQCIFRVNRDIRFSKDKSPYKINMGANLSPGGRKSMSAGYYISIQPGGESFLAGGKYQPSKEGLAAIRDAIDYDASDLHKIIDSKSFKKYFDGLSHMGDKLKTAPKGYPKDHPEIELLKHKSFIVSSQMSDKEVLGKNFMDHCLKVYQEIHPLNTYLEKAILAAQD